MKTIVVGSRASHLAQAQVREYLAPLREKFPGIDFRHRIILEAGDRDRITDLASVSTSNGGAAFANEQEAALARGDVDVVVHSLKDLPTALTPGLVLLAPPPREDVRDALCGNTIATLPPGAKVGTGAVRRIAQLLHVRPDLRMVPIRGNVPPRLNKLKTMDLQGVVLAAAGLRRLGLADRIGELLPIELFPPSPGQGALGIQVRAADEWIHDVLAAVGDGATDVCVRAERAMLADLHGGCSVPVGAFAAAGPGGGLALHGQVTSPDGRQRIDATATGTQADPEALGRSVARQLIEDGAEQLLATLRPAVT